LIQSPRVGVHTVWGGLPGQGIVAQGRDAHWGRGDPRERQSRQRGFEGGFLVAGLGRASPKPSTQSRVVLEPERISHSPVSPWLRSSPLSSGPSARNR
jgi:hypothetical protein